MATETQDAGARGPPRDADLIALIAELVREMRGERGERIEVRPASRLDRDLGIDSLGRTELILRIERRFQIQLPLRLMGEVDTVADLLAALRATGPAPTKEVPSAPTPLPPVAAAADARTLIEALDWHVARHPDRLHATVLQDDRTVLAELSYGELAGAARSVAAGLLARGIVSGDRVALMLPTGFDFFVAFFGVLYGGGIPVPIYPPMQLTQIEDYARRQAGILRNAQARVLITVPEGLRLGSLLRALVPSIESVESVASLSAAADVAVSSPRIDSAAVALIQYTSGSTGDPKGVVLSHNNVLANIRAIGKVIEASSDDVMVSWLPLYHDMGLIGSWLGSLYFGARFCVMSPLAFLARPQTWLWAIHRFRGTISAAPNFAFELCLDKIDDAALAGLDLSSLRMLANGAEPVSAATLRRFTERFRPYGFRPEAMAPVYGLAENAVAVTLPPPGRLPRIERISRSALSERGLAEPPRDEADTMEIVGCGMVIPGHEVRIVDERGRELAERHEGRLEFRGPSATAGYFRNEAKTRALFDGDWLDSGDRGYLSEGEVFITGRIKDIVIRAGQHIYPHEVEDAVGQVPGIRKGAAAMFGVSDPSSGTERIIVLAETELCEPDVRSALQARARQAVFDAVGVAPDEIVLLRPGSVPKTLSGKVRRAAAKELYLRGQLEAPPRAIRWQILRLSLAGMTAQLAHLANVAREAAYAVWWWLVVGASVGTGALAVLLLPRLDWRWAAVRGLARLTLAAVGASPSVRARDRIPDRGAVLMVNHASYVDALVLAAVLPGEPAFLAKKEFVTKPLVGTLLRRLGALFVQRFDLVESLADLTAAVAAAGRDRLLVVFPEGTFTRRPGLSGFFLGGFMIASEAGLPVVPGVLRGTRSMLRSDQWFPRRAALSFEIAEPVLPDGKDFAAVVRLRDRVRSIMLARCGEPDLNELIKPPDRRSNGANHEQQHGSRCEACGPQTREPPFLR
jgi:1-acyl-sn-glycerol-3-phosphate acyltransferase